MKSIIQIKDLKRDFVLTEGTFHKKKRIVPALRGINFEVNQGEIFGLLGPNGAGKTTTIKILTTLLLPTSGQVSIFGKDIQKQAKEIRPDINFIFGGERSLYWRLSAEDNLKYFADLYNIDVHTQKKIVPELLELVGLSDRAKTKVETFSKGMKQRLQIARGLINDPKIIFLDEPTIGLDPEASLGMRKLIIDLKSRGKTILLTTHYMVEADILCDRIGVINHGEIVALDTPQGLKSLAHGWSTLELKVFGLNDDVFQEIKKMSNVDFATLSNVNEDQVIRIQTSKMDHVLPLVLQYLEDKYVRVLDVVKREATLEDAYLKLLGGVA